MRIFHLWAFLTPLIQCSNTLARRDVSWNESRVESSGYRLATPQSTFTAPCPLSTAISTLHQVTVGKGGALLFQPNQVMAGVGDTIRFTFFGLNHTLTQSSLSHPCASNGGFDTGFHQFNPQNMDGKFILDWRVKDLEAQWFYCAQTKPKSHCGSGMVFALNTGGKIGEFISAATSTSSTSTSSSSTSTSTSSTSTSTLLTSSTSATSSHKPVPSSGGITWSHESSSLTEAAGPATTLTPYVLSLSYLVSSTGGLTSPTGGAITPVISNSNKLKFPVVTYFFTIFMALLVL